VKEKVCHPRLLAPLVKMGFEITPKIDLESQRELNPCTTAATVDASQFSRL
jgi:hypothetical protein